VFIKKGSVLVPKIIMGDTQELIPLYFFVREIISILSEKKQFTFVNCLLGNSDNMMVFCQLC